MKIRITDDADWTRIAPAAYRFTAIDGDTYDGPGCPIGSGATPAEAERDLLEQLSDLDAWESEQQRRDCEESDRLAFERAHAWGRS